MNSICPIKCSFHLFRIQLNSFQSVPPLLIRNRSQILKSLTQLKSKLFQLLQLLIDSKACTVKPRKLCHNYEIETTRSGGVKIGSQITTKATHQYSAENFNFRLWVVSLFQTIDITHYFRPINCLVFFPYLWNTS